jgi:hypothetical protein
LIPTLHQKTHADAVIQQMALIVAGVALIASVHHYADGFGAEEARPAFSSGSLP